MVKYSKHTTDFKNLVVKMYLRIRSLRKTSTLTDVPKSTIFNWVNRCPLIRKRHVQSPSNVKAFIASCLDADPFLSSFDIMERFRRQQQGNVAASTIRRHIRNLGFTRKRPSKVPNNQGLEERRTRWAQGERHNQWEDVISIDETSICYDFPKASGYARRGHRVPMTLHTHHRHRMTLIMAVNRRGVVHWELFQGSTDSNRFAGFVSRIPGAYGTRLLMDNAAFHKSSTVREACSRVGTQPTYLPPYTPFFQPVEHVFAILKHRYGKERPSTTFSFDDVRSRLITAITTGAVPATCANCFAACRRRVTAYAENQL